ELADLLHPFGVTVREVNAQEAVRLLSRSDDRPNFTRIPTKRLLAKSCHTGFKCLDRLCRMLSAGGSDHHAVEILSKKLFKVSNHRCLWCNLLGLVDHLGGGIGDGDRDPCARGQDCFHPVATDPPDAEKAEASRLCLR